MCATAAKISELGATSMPSLERVEEALIQQPLHRTRRNQTRAAQLLDISRDALRYKMKNRLQEAGG
jgi:DNA-binding protein Fis